MAFSSVLKSREVAGKGIIKEVYSWDGDSVTTGDITADTADAESIGEITEVDYAIPANDNDNTTNVSLDGSTVTLTFTSSDTGELVLFGKAR